MTLANCDPGSAFIVDFDSVRNRICWKFSPQKPTLLAKIVGVYRIGCNSKLTNTPIRRDLLVMENLFYNSKVDKVRACSSSCLFS